MKKIGEGHDPDGTPFTRYQRQDGSTFRAYDPEAFFGWGRYDHSVDPGWPSRAFVTNRLAIAAPGRGIHGRKAAAP